MINYQTVYYARYTPKMYGKLPVYDQLPLFIPLLIMGPTCLAINIHWIPPPLRLRFVQFIDSLYKRYPDNQKMRFRIWYQTIKNNPSLHFALPAVRRYYIARFSNLVEIENKYWEQLPVLSMSKYRARFLRMTNPGLANGFNTNYSS